MNQQTVKFMVVMVVVALATQYAANNIPAITKLMRGS